MSCQGADAEAGARVKGGEAGAGLIESGQRAIGQGRTLEGCVEVLLRPAEPMNKEDSRTIGPVAVEVWQRKVSAMPLDS